MVLAFIISTLTGESPFLLYHQEYGHIANAAENQCRKTDNHNGDASELIRQLRKQYIALVAERVHSEYNFQREISFSPDEDAQRSNNDADTLPDFIIGHFRISAPTITTDVTGAQPTHHVTWMGSGVTAFSLLCDEQENRVLAVQVLRMIVRFLQEYVRVLSQPAEVAGRIERVAEVLERVLPDGNLLFMNHRVIRMIEKELDSAMKALS